MLGRGARARDPFAAASITAVAREIGQQLVSMGARAVQLPSSPSTTLPSAVSTRQRGNQVCFGVHSVCWSSEMIVVFEKHPGRKKCDRVELKLTLMN